MAIFWWCLKCKSAVFRFPFVIKYLKVTHGNVFLHLLLDSAPLHKVQHVKSSQCKRRDVPAASWYDLSSTYGQWLCIFYYHKICCKTISGLFRGCNQLQTISCSQLAKLFSNFNKVFFIYELISFWHGHFSLKIVKECFIFYWTKISLQFLILNLPLSSSPHRALGKDKCTSVKTWKQASNNSFKIKAYCIVNIGIQINLYVFICFYFRSVLIRLLVGQ